MTSNRNNSGQAQVEELISAYESFINAFDGSTPDAFAAAEPMMDTIFASDFTFVTEDGPKDLAWYRDFAKGFAAGEGNVARVTSIKPTSSGIQVTINNTVAGVVIDPITYNGTTVIDENGHVKLSHFEAADTSGDKRPMQNVGKMVALVSEPTAEKEEDSKDLPVIFICKMVVRSDKIDDFQSQARQAVEDMKSEQGLRSFELYFSGDGSSCHTVENYKHSQAAIEHLQHMQKNEHRNEAIAMFKVTELEVYGAACEDLKALLDGEDYGVTYFESCGISLSP